MGKTLNQVRELHASMACELAYRAFVLTDELDEADHAQQLGRIKQLVAVLEITTTQLLLRDGVSWEKIGSGMDGVTRQSFHRRLSPKIAQLMDLAAGEIQLGQSGALHGVEFVPDAHWRSQLQLLYRAVDGAADNGFDPAVVKHRRSQSPAPTVD